MLPGILPSLVENSPEISLGAGQQVFNQGQPAENFLVVVSGSVTVFARSSEGREVVLYRVKAGELCILTTACLIGHTKYPAEGITDSETCAHVIPAKAFNEFLEGSAPFRQFVFEGLSSRLAQVTKRFEHMVLESVQKRLATFLLAHSGEGGAIRITHEKLAVEIGTAREVVSRHLKSMESRGLIRLERGQITVLNPSGLQATV